MSEELIRNNLVNAPKRIGDWKFYNIGVKTLKVGIYGVLSVNND